MSRRRNRSKSPATNILFTTTSRTHQRKKLKRWMLWGAALIVTLSAVGVGTHFAVQELMKRVLYENPRYALRDIRVEVKGNIPKRQVVQAARLVVGQNVMKLDLRRIQHEVEQLPYVDDAQVIRQLPDCVILRVTERVPVARLISLRMDLNVPELYYVDRDGTAIKPQPNEPLRNVPEITGGHFADVEAGQRMEQPEVLAALNLLKQIELTPLRTLLDIHHFDVSRPLTLGLCTKDGSRIYFRFDHVDRQLDRLREILEFAQRRDQQIATVDLTPERNVPATFRN